MSGGEEDDGGAENNCGNGDGTELGDKSSKMQQMEKSFAEKNNEKIWRGYGVVTQ